MSKSMKAIYMDSDGNVLMPCVDEVTSPGNIAGFADVNLFEESVSQKFALGTKIVQGDRVFRYVRNGGSGIAVGKLVTGAASGADHVKDLVVAANAAIGAKSVTVTNGGTTAITANMFAQGYMFVNDATGEGQCLRIKSHPAAATSATCVFTLYDPLTVALVASTSEVGLKKNPYDAIVVSATTPVAAPLGVTVVGLTAAYFGWIQTGGPAAVLTNGTVIVGKFAVVGLTTAGSVDVKPLNSVDASGQEPNVGVVMSVGATTEYSLVNLLLDR